jgi:carboxyl-terminal processing protease
MSLRARVTVLTIALFLPAVILPARSLPSRAEASSEAAGPQEKRPDSVRAAARRFADHVLDAARTLSESHIKEPDERELSALAARGLWEHFSPTVPPNMARRLERARGMRKAELRALLILVRAQLGHRPEVEGLRDVDIALQAIFRRLEPGFTPEPLAEQIGRPIRCHFGRHYEPGLLLRPHASGAMLEVVTPVLDSPAYRAGIQAGDAITRITYEMDQDGRPLQEPWVFSTKGLSVDEAMWRLLGKEGTRLKLTIVRPGAAKEVTIEVTRAAVVPGTVVGPRRNKRDHFEYLLDPEARIGYVRLARFARDTHRDLAKAMKDLSPTGIKGLILDVRFNPGGLVDSGIKVADLFIDDGPITTVRPRQGPATAYFGGSGGSYTAFPMVCLVNGESWGVTEVVAACLQDNGRALIVGERSAGETGIRSLLPLRSGGTLKFTSSVFDRANGRTLSKLLTNGLDDEDWGVRPDEGSAVLLSARERAALHEHLQRLEIIPRRDRAAKPTPRFHDRQLETALAYLRGQIASAERAPRQPAGKRGWAGLRLASELREGEPRENGKPK